MLICNFCENDFKKEERRRERYNNSVAENMESDKHKKRGRGMKRSVRKKSRSTMDPER